jgi:1-acyl-sn-glycerol-3-phosphate acyltransferase
VKPSPLQLLRNLLFYVFYVPSIIIWGLLVSLAIPLPYAWRWKTVNVWVHLTLWWLRFSCGVRHEVKGLENLPEQTAIIMSKHQSTWETIGFQAIFPAHVWVLKKELLKIPFFGWGLKSLEAIAIDRNAGRRAVVQVARQGLERLKAGRWVVVFPEGTRTAPGTQGRYKLGGAVLAVKSGYPVVPVAHNAGEYWPKHWLYKYPGVITVSIGPVIESEGRDAESLMGEAEKWIETEMRAISKTPYQENSVPQD